MELKNPDNTQKVLERQQEYNNLPKKSPRKNYREPTSDDFFDFGRIQRVNNATKRPRERPPVDAERQKEYNDVVKTNGKPKPKPFRENSKDDFFKYGGHQRRVNHNGNRRPSSERL